MQKMKLKLMHRYYEIEGIVARSNFAWLGVCLVLSWIYAVSSQCYIPLPFNPVPFTLQGVTFLFCAWRFGRIAVFSYILYLLQGLAGAPFFSHGGSGFLHLLGPTGGYLIGFLFAMTFMALTRDIATRSNVAFVLKTWISMLIYFIFGIVHLTLFIPVSKALAVGFYPFFLSDFVIKVGGMLLLASVFKYKNIIQGRNDDKK